MNLGDQDIIEAKYKNPQSNPTINSCKLQWNNAIVKRSEDKCSFMFTIIKFSKLEKNNGEYVISEEFTMEKNKQIKWRLVLYPNGDDKKNEGCLVVRLINVNPFEVTVLFRAVVIDCSDEQSDIQYEKNYRTIPAGMEYGGKIVSKKNLFSRKEALLPDDNLTLLCSITIIHKNIIQHVTGSIIKKKEVRHCEINVLQELFKRNEFKDFCLVVEGKEIKVHRSILAAHSNVFSAMLNQNMKEQRESRLIITDFKYEIIDEMVNFMYTGKLKDLKSTAENLLPPAEKYEINHLKDLCEQSLIDDLDIVNVSSTLVYADLYHLSDLKMAAKNFIVRFKEKVCSTDDYKDVVALNPYLILEAFMEEEPPMKRKCFNP